MVDSLQQIAEAPNLHDHRDQSDQHHDQDAPDQQRRRH
jgi:hypothetical protein